MIRHEWTTDSGDDLAIVIEDTGCVRLLFKGFWDTEWKDQHPREWPHSLLSLAASLLIEQKERGK